LTEVIHADSKTNWALAQQQAFAQTKHNRHPMPCQGEAAFIAASLVA
jgi:hypothetical protein